MNPFQELKYYVPQPASEAPLQVKTDLCVYGGTSAGVSAAVQARLMGMTVAIVEFGAHLGGLSSGGLGATDIGNKSAIGGIARQFYRELGQHYADVDEPEDSRWSHEADGSVWKFEPHVAEGIFNKWVEEADIPVYLNQHLAKVEKSQGNIRRIVTESGNAFEASMFIDATYEGDLLAMAGVRYHVGREPNSQYKETLNGVHFGDPNHNFRVWVDPYRIEGKPDSGLLPGISDAAPGFQGQGDRSVQAYNFRVCLTKVEANRIPFPQPPQYDPEQFTLLARYIRAGIWDAMKLHIMMPCGKTDLNNKGAVSSDHIGANCSWPDGDYATRERIFQSHVNYNLGMLYFLANDERIPAHIRAEVGQWGLPADEFVRTGGWPHQLYIREARRMVSDVVMTEHYCRKFAVAEDSVGLAAYTMDSHNCRRIVIDGRCVNEGNVEVKPEGPYPISYCSIIPSRGECANLLVPVCLSSSHIAYGSIRMEPVFMILGQSAATAAGIALEQGVDIQDVDYAALRERLLKDGQILMV